MTGCETGAAVDTMRFHEPPFTLPGVPLCLQCASRKRPTSGHNRHSSQRTQQRTCKSGSL